MSIDASPARHTHGFDPKPAGKDKCKPETKRFLFDLADGWALGADEKQWMLLIARKRHAQTIWQPVAFIASTKSILLRCMLENGIQPTVEARANIDRLPERFPDWRKTRLDGFATEVETVDADMPSRVEVPQ